MIYIVIVRRAHCEVCGGRFDLEPEEKPPLLCRLCNSSLWMYGVIGHKKAPRRLMRQGLVKVEKVVDKSAKSLKRQEQGKRQWRRFRTKEQDDQKRLEEKDAKGHD